jgi:phosphate starvation-inducible protein PhoH
MARAPRKTALTSSTNPQLERQARRITRQQKQLDRELINQMGQNSPAKLVGAAGRVIALKNLKRLAPLTDMQGQFFDAYDDGGDAFVLYGSAGTGKSFLALYHALRDVLDTESVYDKIIIIRSCVQSRQMGFTPGSEEDKSAPYELPYHAICSDLLGRADAYQKLKDCGKIEFMSTSFLRGATFNNAIIIFDEAQNTTFAESSTVISRMGKESKIIIAGDIKQDDLVHNKNDVSGFRCVLDVTGNMPEFDLFKFTSDDICRSSFVKSWIINCERLGL